MRKEGFIFFLKDIIAKIWNSPEFIFRVDSLIRTCIFIREDTENWGGEVRNLRARKTIREKDKRETGRWEWKKKGRVKKRKKKGKGYLKKKQQYIVTHPWYLPTQI